MVVPDELALTVWGHDPHAFDLTPTIAAGAARAVLICEPLSAPLSDALAELEDAVPGGTSRTTVTLSGPPHSAGKHAVLVGHEPSADAEAGDGERAHDHRHDEAPDAGGHDRDDDARMMAITGEPSADGLVMEPIQLSYGPLLTPLPGGVMLEVELDGDVVSRCEAWARLRVAQATGETLVPDPLASAAWTAVLEAAAMLRMDSVASEVIRWRRVVAVELERAVSHLAWLRSFARLLGWTLLVDRVQPALTALAESRAASPAGMEPLELATAVTEEVVALLRRHRAFTARTRGVGFLGADARGSLYGPNARAAGVARDVRAGDGLYAEVGFEPVLEHSGDAHARALVRAREASQSIGLAAGAAKRLSSATARSVSSAHQPGAPVVVEGPRGPLTARATDDGLGLRAPGERAAITVAGRAAVGREWAAALVGVASLDLSPWWVGG